MLHSRQWIVALVQGIGRCHQDTILSKSNLEALFAVPSAQNI
jgi:hypothetical protein